MVLGAEGDGEVNGGPFVSGGDVLLGPFIGSTEEGGGAASKVVPLVGRVGGEVEDEGGLLDKEHGGEEGLDGDLAFFFGEAGGEEGEGVEASGGFVVLDETNEKAFTLAAPGLEGDACPLVAIGGNPGGLAGGFGGGFGVWGC